MTEAYAAYCFHQNVSDVAIYAGGSFIRAISGEAVGAFGLFGVVFGALFPPDFVDHCTFGVSHCLYWPSHNCNTSIFTSSVAATPSLICLDAHSVRSISASVNHHVSLIIKSTLFPFAVFVTRTFVPKGRPLCAALRAFLSNASHDAVYGLPLL